MPEYLTEIDPATAAGLAPDDPNVAAGPTGDSDVDHEQLMGALVDDDDPVLDAEVATREDDVDEGGQR